MRAFAYAGGRWQTVPPGLDAPELHWVGAGPLHGRRYILAGAGEEMLLYYAPTLREDRRGAPPDDPPPDLDGLRRLLADLGCVPHPGHARLRGLLEKAEAEGTVVVLPADARVEVLRPNPTEALVDVAERLLPSPPGQVTAEGGEALDPDAIEAQWATLPPPPWVPDVDDPQGEHPAWTGKFYTGDRPDTGGDTWDTYSERDPATLPGVRAWAEARGLVPRLCAEVRRLRAELERAGDDAQADALSLAERLAKLKPDEELPDMDRLESAVVFAVRCLVHERNVLHSEREAYREAARALRRERKESVSGATPEAEADPRPVWHVHRHDREAPLAFSADQVFVQTDGDLVGRDRTAEGGWDTVFIVGREHWVWAARAGGRRP